MEDTRTYIALIMQFKNTKMKKAHLFASKFSTHKVIFSSYEWFHLHFAETNNNHPSWLDSTFRDSIVTVYLYPDGTFTLFICDSNHVVRENV
jgi:hypothetical protein